MDMQSLNQHIAICKSQCTLWKVPYEKQKKKNIKIMMQTFFITNGAHETNI